MTYTPVIIIGAGRSGTNMLRDTLTKIDGVNTWPCDEINYIWRHYNVSHPTDEFTREMATKKVKNYIQHEFDKMASESNTSHLLEKTCANSLRAGFVHEIYPSAKYIHIIRDGRDVVESAKKRWTASLEPSYISQKVKYVPKSDLPYYGFKYFTNRIYKLFSKENRLAYWGPNFNGLEELLRQNVTLEEVCAHQWKQSVDRATEAFETIPKDQVYTVYYEDLTKEPIRYLKSICDFLNIDYTNELLSSITSEINNKSVGKGKSKLSERNILDKVNSIIKNTMEKHHYETEDTITK
ncbi:sulfotransferase [Virgibacillus necropolis]|uniref:sulfotransferase family protein n=1 Tax=Virgibacillus necropolis TaxID=163877 RepID=UPI00384AD2F3